MFILKSGSSVVLKMGFEGHHLWLAGLGVYSYPLRRFPRVSGETTPYIFSTRRGCGLRTHSGAPHYQSIAINEQPINRHPINIVSFPGLCNVKIPKSGTVKFYHLPVDFLFIFAYFICI
jgi:hypothetical protein